MYMRCIYIIVELVNNKHVVNSVASEGIWKWGMIGKGLARPEGPTRVLAFLGGGSHPPARRSGEGCTPPRGVGR